MTPETRSLITTLEQAEVGSGEPICPVTADGFHQKRPWHDREANVSGLACRACHKTWRFQGERLVSTYGLYERRALESQP